MRNTFHASLALLLHTHLAWMKSFYAARVWWVGPQPAPCFVKYIFHTRNLHTPNRLAKKCHSSLWHLIQGRKQRIDVDKGIVSTICSKHNTGSISLAVTATYPKRELACDFCSICHLCGYTPDSAAPLVEAVAASWGRSCRKHLPTDAVYASKRR